MGARARVDEGKGRWEKGQTRASCCSYMLMNNSSLIVTANNV